MCDTKIEEINKLPVENFSLHSQDPKEIICALLRVFYANGWCTGSGGGISIRKDDDNVYVAPSGVQKELVLPQDIYTVNVNGEVCQNPSNQKLRPSECTPLFNAIYKLRNAGAALHSHSHQVMLVTRLFNTEVQMIDFEMIKGIKGHKNSEWCLVPIIENTEQESLLTERLQAAIIAYPRTYAVLVKNHGMYCWGETWERAKVHAECYDYLFGALIKLKMMNLEIKRIKEPHIEFRQWYLRDDLKDLSEDGQYHQYMWKIWQYSPTKNGYFETLKFDIENEEKGQQQIEKIKKDANIKLVDQITIANKQVKSSSREISYENLIAMHSFKKPYVIFITKGSIFIDVKNKEKQDKKEEIIRSHFQKGDIVIVLGDIIHRYVQDQCGYVTFDFYIKENQELTEFVPQYSE